MIADPNQAPRQEPENAPQEGPPATRRERVSRLERFAVIITGAVGSIRFFAIVVTWTASWLLWNAFAPKATRFDAYPAFVLWLFISNVVQLFIMPLILVDQNLQARASDKRAEADLAINRKAEAEVQAIRTELTELKRILIAHVAVSTERRR